jgi:hypothetical protein
MSNAVGFANVNLPSIQSLSTALRALDTGVSSGSVILKMDKTGHWVFGADQTEVESGSNWAVNPFSFIHGFIAWGEGDVLGEKMVPVTQPLPEMDEAPPTAKRGWETQVGMSLKCLDGEDKDMEVRFATTSVGGKRAVQEMAAAIAAQVDADVSKPVPVVTLQKEHYQHKSYGRIFTPVFKVVQWVGMDGAAEPVVAAEEPELDLQPTGRRRRPAAT